MSRILNTLGLAVPGPAEPAEPEWASDAACQENARFLQKRLRTQPALRSSLLTTVAISNTRKVLCYVRILNAKGEAVVEPYFAWRQTAAGTVVSHAEAPLARSDKICFEPTSGLVRKKLEMVMSPPRVPGGSIHMAMAQLPEIVFTLRAAKRRMPSGDMVDVHGMTMDMRAPDAAAADPPAPMMVEDIFVRVKPGMQPTGKEAFSYIRFRLNAGRVIRTTGKHTVDVKLPL